MNPGLLLTFLPFRFFFSLPPQKIDAVERTQIKSSRLLPRKLLQKTNFRGKEIYGNYGCRK
jgi:hypothetical protein